MSTLDTIIISIIASSVFAIIVYLLTLIYDYLKFKKNVGRYERVYQKEKQELKGEIAAIAEVNYGYKREMKITVTTLIEENENLHFNKHHKFTKEEIQKWHGKITMENIEAGKLYWYYFQPVKFKEKYRSGFKRVLFLDDSKMLKLFGESGFGEELFIRK